MLDAYIYAGLRSPFGRHAGKLAAVRPDDLAAAVIAAVVKKAGLKPGEISDVLLGNVNQAGEDCRNVARFAALLAGLPPTTPGATVNRLCASGLQATLDAARAITCGEGELYIAGGVESMSRAPYVMAKAESAYSRDVKMYDTTIGARFMNPRFAKQYGTHSMPETGDNVARDFGVSRAQADEFALASQQKYVKAEAEGFYQGEILPIALPTKKKDAPPLMVDLDEHPRRDASMESLAKLKPLFEGGVVTAGNASGVNDGAALEQRFQLGQRFHRGIAARVLVELDHDRRRVLLFRRQRDREDLAFVEAFGLGLHVLLLRGEGELVGLRARHAEILGDVVSGFRHRVGAVLLGKARVHEARAYGGVVHFYIARVGRLGFAHYIGRTRHAFHAAGDVELALAAADRARGVQGGLQAACTQAVDGRPRSGRRQAGQQCGEARDVAAILASLIDVAEQHVADLPRLEPGLLDQRSDDRGGEIVRPHRGELACVPAERRAKSIVNISVQHGVQAPDCRCGRCGRQG